MKNEKINLVAFDADDTLWAHENIFQEAQVKFKTSLEKYSSNEITMDKLHEYERKNLQYFGYGVKGFMLSMIETAIELTSGRIPGNEIQQIIDLGRWMLNHPVHILDNVEFTLNQLRKSGYTLIIITKGDLFDQETKIARSGLAENFDAIEIVSEKKPEIYQSIFTKYDFDPSETVMIGNSLKSDILPVLAIGGHAVHIPFHVTWVLEQVEDHQLEGHEYHQLSDISMVPDFLETLT